MNKFEYNMAEKKLDILEDDIMDFEPTLLRILLKDKTTQKNILWCTKDYENQGNGFQETDEIKIEHITGKFAAVVQPRAAKTKEIQTMRVRSRAEVFTPSWVCNEQNNQIDNAWFGRENVFNKPNGNGWITRKSKIEFKEKKWEKYVDAKRLEITCGEAPYLVSRYDTTTGKIIPIYRRIGLFDRKMRVVNENCETDAEWIKWSKRALQSVYGYEFQGDNVLIARENLLYSYIDYYNNRFKNKPDVKLLKKIANIISWNIWQMDGLTMTAPFSERQKKNDQYSLFDYLDDLKITETEPIPCRIYDWRSNNSLEFKSMMGGGLR